MKQLGGAINRLLAQRGTVRGISLRTRIVALLVGVSGATALAGACANPAAPPGGPPDELPPLVVSITPDVGDTSVRPKVVVIQFDEVINETPKGAPNLADLVFISPRSGDVEVAWKRSRMEIKPKDGFRDSSVYTITIKRGIQDLRNNSIDSSITVVFSTRGPIPQTAITGVVFDWPAGTGANAPIVEAIPVTDTTRSYITVADSVGRFVLRHVPQGQYIVRGFVDRNNNRRLERSELWDTTRVPLIDSAAVELYSFIRDTLPVQISEIAVQDSGRRIRLTFDKPLANEQTFTPEQFTFRSLPDSAPMALRTTAVRTAAQQIALDSADRQRRADSTAAAAAARDTVPKDSATLARADSVARARRLDSLARADRAERDARRLAAQRGGRTPAPVDTTPRPQPSRPTPATELLILLDAALPDEARILIQAADVTSLNGIVGTARRQLLTPPKPKAPPATVDTTRVAPPDSAAVPPPDSATVTPPDSGSVPPPDSVTVPPPDSGTVPPPRIPPRTRRQRE